MKVTDIIVILLFIIPGVVAEKISNSMDMPTADKRSEFRELVNGILLSLPIIVVGGSFTCLIYKIDTISKFSESFNQIECLFIFTLDVLIIAVIVGVTKGLMNDRIEKLINIIRGWFGKIEIDSKSCWRKMFLDDPECHYVEVIRGTEVHAGFTRWFSLPNEEKEIVVYIPDYLKHYPEYKDKFTIVNQTYINIEKNIVIKDYDMNEYYSWCQELIEKSEKSATVEASEAEPLES